MSNAVQVLFVLSAIPLVLFPLLYYIIADWHSTTTGRHLMAFSIVLAAVMAEGVARMFFGQYPHRLAILTILWFLVVVVSYHRVWLLYSIQFHPERHPVIRKHTRQGGSNE